MAGDGILRLAELLASLSLATDLGTGQPMGHGMSTCLLAVDVARAMGCGDEEIRTVHQVALLRFLGCTADAADTARQTGGDDIAFLAAIAPAFMGSTSETMRAIVGGVAQGESPWRRARVIASVIGDIGGAGRSIAAHCEVAAMLAGRLGLSAPVVEALAHAFERWDGRGHPHGLSGAEVPLPVRITVVARDADLFRRRGDDVVERLSARRARAYDPEVVDAVIAAVAALAHDAEWDDVLAAEPEPYAAAGDLDVALSAVADFVDLKSPWTRGHSPAVADLAAATVRAIGMGDQTAATVRRAGLVHDVGRVGVPGGIWDHPGPLSTAQWEAVRLHPYHTERILARCRPLAAIADLAAAHHERIDGSGYHRRVGADDLSLPARVLAAADAFVALTAARPHRAPFAVVDAAAVLEREAKAGALDGEAVGWVVATARGEASARIVNPGGLSDREVEVLTLIATGSTIRQAAQRLSISAKTCGRHVENIYAKIGVSTRAGAALYAMEHRLLG